MAIVIDNNSLINLVDEKDRDNIIVLKVTEKEIQEAFRENKFQEKERIRYKSKYTKYHKDIRNYMKRYHRLKEKKNG